MDTPASPSLRRSFELHLRAENRADNTIASYLESIRQAEAFLATLGKGTTRRRPSPAATG